MSTRAHGQGFMLLPVVLILAVIGTIALTLNQKSIVAIKQTASINEFEKARYVAEASFALAQAELEQDIDCAGYTITSNTTFNGIAYNASVTPNNGSPVTVNVSVDLDGGVSKLFSKQITMYENAPDLVLSPVADAYIDGASNGNKYGTNNRLKIKSPASGDYIRSLLLFDLSTVTIPPAQIESTSLDLYVDDSGTSTTDEIAAFTVEEVWAESNVSWKKRTNHNWSTEGGVFNATEVTRTLVDSSSPGFFYWDLTKLTKEWLEGTVTNSGVLLKNTTANTSTIKFFSREYSDTAKVPALRIKYRCECGQSC